MNPRKVERIITHHRPHFDEILGIWLLKKFGGDLFNDIESAEIAYEDAGWIPENEEPDAYEDSNRCVMVGVGGGRFDEHSSYTKDRDHGECAATLVAKFLGIDQKRELQTLLKFARANDLKGGSNSFALAEMVKKFNAAYPDDPEKVLAWAFGTIEAEYQNQCTFWQAGRDFPYCHKVLQYNIRDRGYLKIIVIQSNNEQMVSYARYDNGSRDAMIIVQRKTKGQVQIFLNKNAPGIENFKPDLQNIATVLRVFEQQERFGEVREKDWEALGSERGPEGIPWHLPPHHTMILNGSLTAPNTQATRLPLDQILNIIVNYI